MTTDGGDDWAEDLPSDDIDGSVADPDEVWHLLAELAPDGVFLETVEGRILWANEAAARMFGYAHGEMVGLGISDLVPDEFAETLPPEITRVTGLRTVRRYNRRRDGTVFPTEISTRFVTVAGEKRLVAFVRDISESVAAFHELQSALQKVEALFGIVPICMSCGDVRDDQGYWSRVEDFVAAHAGTRFSHGLCPECLPRVYPEYADGDGDGSGDAAVATGDA